MEHYPTLVARRRLGEHAWAMVLRAENLADFTRFIPGFSRTEHSDTNATFISHDARHTAKFGDVVLLHKETHAVVGVCEGQYFNTHWALVRDLSNKTIPMPVFDANDAPFKTNEVELHDVIVNAIRGEFHDFEDRFETVLAGKQNVVDNKPSDEDRRTWILNWVERNSKDDNLGMKMKDAVMLEKFITAGEFSPFWRVG